MRSICERVSRDYFDNVKISLNYRSIGRGFLKSFYYDCLPPKKRNQSDEDYHLSRQERLQEFDEICKIDGFHVSEGFSRHRRKIVEQKAVDISIAVDMLTHTFMRNMEKATLLTSDLDFLPLVNALVNQGMYIKLWYHQGHTNNDLINAVDAHEPITALDIYSWSNLSFQNSHGLPYSWKSLEKETEGLNKEADFPTESDDEVELYKSDGDKYTMIFKSNGVFQYFRYSDLEVLKKFSSEICYTSKVAWE